MTWGECSDASDGRGASVWKIRDYACENILRGNNQCPQFANAPAQSRYKAISKKGYPAERLSEN